MTEQFTSRPADPLRTAAADIQKSGIPMPFEAAMLFRGIQAASRSGQENTPLVRKPSRSKPFRTQEVYPTGTITGGLGYAIARIIYERNHPQ